ncbi:MAG: response regulator [Verrucomicrobia bacterium]|nr:response regulator [Verrucomicrobiota bacterium]
MKILLVDDADVFRQSVANLLRSRGHEVIEAENGLIGLKLARTHLPDVVVSDIVMSQVDGYAMTSLLRQHPTTADIPLVLITGEADLKGMRKGMTLGADDYIAKPFKMDELVAALELRVHRRRALRDEVEQKLACLGSGIGMTLPGELSQPLKTILDTSRSLAAAGQTLKAEEVIALAQATHAAALRVERLTRNLFLHAQIELFGSNPAHLNALRQALAADAGDVVAAQARRCAEAGARTPDLQLKISPGSAAIAEAHLAKLVEELVGNALQYSSSGTPVTVQSYDDGHDFLLTVMDKGPGMSPELVAGLSFSAPAVRQTGEPYVTGLGLPIARRLAELHGGKLLLHSEPGKGTTVRVSLPARPPAVPAPADELVR